MSAPRTIAALLRHGWARHRLPLVPIVIAVGLFQFLLTRIAPSPREVSWMSTMLQMMPPELRALSGGDFALSPAGFLAIGYAHPFFILLLSAWVVRTSSAAVAGETGSGTMDLLASRPAARWTFIAAGMLTLAAGLAAIVGAAWLGTTIGVSLRPLDMSGRQFLPLVCTTWLLFAAWGAVGLLVGATRREGGQAMGWTIAILAGSFVLDYVARLWAPIAAARPASLFRYYEPPLILMFGIPTTTLVVLAGVLAGGLALAVVVVRRRDL